MSDPANRVATTEHDGDESDPPICEAPVDPPGDVFERIPTGTTLRTELAAAARSRGRTSSRSTELDALCDSLAKISPKPVDFDTARRRIAEASGREERLKERVATLRGDVRARREVEAETDEMLAELESAAAELANAQTERIAAEQALERAQELAGHARDERERRLELRDRLENERREARRELANEVYPAFRDALADVPGGDSAAPGSEPSAYEGPALAASLAAVNVADLTTPVVLDTEAAAWAAERSGTVPESVVFEQQAGDDLSSDC